MLFISLSIIVLSAVLCGWGHLLLKLMKQKYRPGNPWLVFFLGYGFLIVALEYAVVFRKLDGLVLSAVFFLGMLGWVFHLRKTPREKITINFQKLLLFAAALVFVSCVAISLSNFDYPPPSDTTGYHLGIVSWLNNFPLVKGLANLHFRLGNHSGYLQLAAVLDNYKWDNQSSFIMPGLFLFGFFLYCAWEVIFSLLRKENTKSKIWPLFFFPILLLLVIYYHFHTFPVPNLYFDILPMLLATVILNEIVKNFFLSDDSGDKVDTLFLIMINILAAAAYLSKQSAVLILAMTVTFSAYYLIKRREFNIGKILMIFGLPAIGILGSIISNTITSGYPLFPLPFLHFNFPWTISKKSVYDIYDAIRYWAKMPGPNYLSVADNGFSYWFFPWIKRNFSDKLFITVVFVPFVCGITVWAANLAVWGKESRKYFWFFGASILNLLYWFFLAPDIRFGAIFFVIFLSSGLAFLALAINIRYSHFVEKMIKYEKAIAILFVLVAGAYSLYVSDAKIKYLSIKNIYYISNNISYEYQETAAEAKGRGSLTIYMPKDEQCRSKLPCTPYDPQSIGAFDSQDMGAGFYSKDMAK